MYRGSHIGGNIEILIIDKCTKVNSKCYCEQVLQPILNNDVQRRFPDAPESIVFHQDSASGNDTRDTIQFLKNNDVKFTDNAEWMPKSPDADSMDFGIWGILKRRLQKRYLNTFLSHINKL